MTLTVHSTGKWITITSSEGDTLTHEVPRKNKYFKEELRLYRVEIVAWLRGRDCDHLIVYKPVSMSFYRNALYYAIVRATRKGTRLALITTYEETAKVIR